MLNKEIRRKIVERGNELGFGHYCSAMSCVDICATLYNDVMKPQDIFIMAKGHGIIAVLPILEAQGKKVEWKPYLDYDPEQGIEATTASLGHGLPIALGRAFARKLQGRPGRVFVLVGDGEIQEGSNWEALMIARKLELENLVVMIDYNGYQAVQAVKEVSGDTKYSLQAKLDSFGCDTIIADGHDEADTITALIREPFTEGKVPTIIFDTVKGKGVKFLEENQSYHVFYFHERPDVYEQTIKELT